MARQTKEAAFQAIDAAHQATTLAAAEAKAEAEAAVLAAIRKGDVAEVRQLFQGDESLANESRLLEVAFETRNKEIVLLLVKQGAPINSEAFRLAFVHEFLDVLEEMMTRSPQEGRMVFLNACEKGWNQMVKKLINSGADVNKADKEGLYPLLAAYKNEKFEVLRLLIDAGAELKTEKTQNDVEFKKALIRAAVEVNNSRTYKSVPLLKACKKGDAEFTRALIEAGADVNKADENGNALFCACLHHHYSIGLLIIIESGEELASDCNERSLHTIVQQHQYSSEVSKEALDLVKKILERSPSLVDLPEANLLHKMSSPPELRSALARSWVLYRYQGLFERGTTRPTKIKVCVVGEPRAGKTTLIKSLRSIPWENGGDDKRTASVEVTESTGGDLVYCDFAGQRFFHKTHGLFFSASSTVFLLVVNLTEDVESLTKSSYYWASFIKCSVFLVGKAHVVVIGSQKDKLPRDVKKKEKVQKVQKLRERLQDGFGQWFDFYDECFILNCRSRDSPSVDALKRNLDKLKRVSIKTASDVPIIAETAQKVLLPVLRSPTTPIRTRRRYSLSRQSSKVELAQAKIIQQDIISLMKEYLNSDKAGNWFLTSNLFQTLMNKGVCVGEPEVQSLFVEFLQTIGEILVVLDIVVLNVPWLCHNVLGPLMSPDSFSTHLDSSKSGIVSKENIRSALEIFNEKPWEQEHLDRTIKLLCHLEICYLLGPDTYQFPALITEQRPDRVWRKNLEMTIYVGRRVKSEGVDIVTPGTMPCIQSRVRKHFKPSEPVVWQGGIFIRTIDRPSVEGMIVFQDGEKAVDFVVRGPGHSEWQCLKHLKDLRNIGEQILREKSPGTTQSLWYISCAELKQHEDFPAAYKSQLVDAMKKQTGSWRSIMYSEKETVQDTLRDLFALPDDHFTLLPYKVRRAVWECLDKDTEGRSKLASGLPGVSLLDRHPTDAALSCWTERLDATTKIFAEVAKELKLLYLLAILHESGALNLPVKMKIDAEKDYFGLQNANSPSEWRRTRLSGDDTDSAGLWLQMPVSAEERVEAARRIPAQWRHIGRFLEPEPKFQEYDLELLDEERDGRHRAQKMLDKWAEKHGSRATRKRLIEAMIKEDLRARVSEIFPRYSDVD